MLTAAWVSCLCPVLDQGLEGPSNSMRNLQNLGGRGGPRPNEGCPSPEAGIRVESQDPVLIYSKVCRETGQLLPC